MVTSSIARWFQQTLYVAVLLLLVAGGIRAADDPGPAKLETVKSITQYGITWTFDKEVQAGRFVTGDYFVIGPVTVVKIDPAPVGEGEAFRNGSMLNPPTNTDQAYDGRIRGFKPNLVAKAPLTLKANDSLLSSISVEERNKLQNAILANPSKATEESPIRTIAILTCLAAPPPADAFRPSYCDLKKSKFYLARNVLWEALPKVKAVEAKSGDQLWVQRYAKDAFDARGVPTFAWLERAFERPWVDHIYGWDSRNMHPIENMPGYGRELGRMVSYAALALCTDVPKEQKEKLCLRFIQVGIDNWGVATRSKRGSEGGWPAAGGFGNGRKLPIVFAGYMLNDLEGMRMIRKYAPECSFGEDEHVVAAERPQRVWIDESRARLQRMIDAALPDTNNSFVRTPNGKQLVVTARSDRLPTRWYLLDEDKKTMEELFASRPWIKPGQLAEMRPFLLKTRDGLEIPSYYFLPNDYKPGTRLPTVVHVHGGPTVRADIWGAFSYGVVEAQVLASRGYAVVLPNFRGTPGFGGRIYYAGFGAIGRQMLDDHEDAAKWAVEQGFADPERICISGASYGGYATLMSLARFPATFKCGVAGLIVSDMKMLLTSPAGDIPFSPSAVAFWNQLVGADSPSKYPPELSPVNVADRIKQPVFIYAGAEDIRTPLEQTTAMVRALERAGNPPKKVLIKPEEGHGFGKVENNVDLFQEMLKFLDAAIGPKRGG